MMIPMSSSPRWAATLGVVLAVSRAFIIDPATAAFHPELAMLEVCELEHLKLWPPAASFGAHPLAPVEPVLPLYPPHACEEWHLQAADEKNHGHPLLPCGIRQVVAHTHHMPRHWRGRAHTQEVQGAFQELFQFKAALLAEEMLSILATPFVLYFSLPRCASATSSPAVWLLAVGCACEHDVETCCRGWSVSLFILAA